MTVKEHYEAAIAAAEAEVAKLRAELAVLPSEVHTLEQEAWQRIKSFFAANPSVAASAAASPEPAEPPKAP